MSPPRHLVLLCALAALGACSAKGIYTPTGARYPGRGPDCEFEVVRHPVTVPYEEVGVIDIAAFHPGSMPKNDKQFRKVVEKSVCRFGGDAVIPVINGVGTYVLGRVIRLRPRVCDDCKEGEDSTEDSIREGVHLDHPLTSLPLGLSESPPC